MNKLINMAKKLNVFFRIVRILLSVAAVTCLVCLGIIAVGFIFQLQPEMIGTGYEILDIGNLELTVADGYVPDEKLVLVQTAITIVLALVCILIGRRVIDYIREILQPMAQGKPFHNTVSTNLKKLAILSVVLCVAGNCIHLVSQILEFNAYHATDLLLSEKITHVTINYHFDLTALGIAAALLLLSCVFRYGEELQQLSDETL